MVVAIGLNLFLDRLQNTKLVKKFPLGKKHTHEHSHTHHNHEHSHAHHAHNHTHEYTHAHNHHEHEHEHEHSHGGQIHSHLPPDVNGTPVTWKNLLALGISGGILPCPSALVLLLSAIALGHIGFGLMLVLAFSLGLAGVLTTLGLVLVYSKRFFEGLPTKMPLIMALPAVSSLCIALVGLGITTQALMQIGLIKFS